MIDIGSEQCQTFDLVPCDQYKEGCVIFFAGGKEIIKLCPDGRILIRGEQVDSNVDVYRAMVDFLGLNLGLLGS